MELENVQHLSDEAKAKDLRVLAREIKRMCEFADLSLNPETTSELLNQIEISYNIVDVRGFADECK